VRVGLEQVTQRFIGVVVVESLVGGSMRVVMVVRLARPVGGHVSPFSYVVIRQGRRCPRRSLPRKQSNGEDERDPTAVCSKTCLCRIRDGVDRDPGRSIHGQKP